MLAVHTLLTLVAGLAAVSADPPGPDSGRIAVRLLRPADDPYRLLLHDGTLFVSGFRSGRVSALDLLTGQTLRHTTLDAYEAFTRDGKPRQVRPYCGGPLALAAGKLFVEQMASDTLLVVDPPTMRVVKRLPLGHEGELAAAPDGSFVVYASNRQPEFHLINPTTYEHTTVAYPSGGRGIGAVVVAPDGRSVVLGIQRGGTHPSGKVLGGGNSFLAVYDLEEKKYTATVYLAEQVSEATSDDGYAAALRFAPDGKTLYAGMFQSQAGVRLIDPATWMIRDDIRFRPNARNRYFAWTNPMSLVFYRGWLMVANRENQEVVIVNPATRRSVARLRFPEEGHAFRHVATEGDRLYLADEASVYELDAWGLARRLAIRPQKESEPPLELSLVAKEPSDRSR